MRIAIVTGGTGGHIYPALSFAEALKASDSNSEIIFLGNKNRMEAQLIPENGYVFTGLSSLSSQGGLIVKFKSLLSLVKAYFEARKILKQFKAEAVLGFGNYVSVPVILAAKHLGLKTYLHEQNAIAGKANLWLAKQVDGVALSYAKSLDDFKNTNARVLGNPRSFTIKQHHRSSALEKLGLNKNKKTVLIVMGSLGSMTVNAMMPEILKHLEAKGLQLIYVTGKQYYKTFSSKISDSDTLKILPFIDQISAMRECDLMICRGGATTCSEIAELGTASVIIPSPYVPHDHQTENAKALFEAGAAVMVHENEINPSQFSEFIAELIQDDKKLERMRLNALKLASPDAAEKLIEWIKGNGIND